MANAKFISAGFLLLAAFAVTAEAKLYKWVDDKGKTHYGETIPPEYADRDNVLLNEKGRIIKRNEKLTAEGKKAQEETEAKKRVEDETAKEQRRKDKMLLNTYSNEKEIDLARDRNLQQVEALINSIQLLQKSAQESLENYQTEAKENTASGKKIPASLRSDIADAENRINRLKSRLTKAQEKADKVRTDFGEDKKRYRELTGSTTEAISSVKATQKP